MSPSPAATGVPCFRPESAAAWAVTRPTTSAGRAMRGSLPGLTPSSAHSSGSHARASLRAKPEKCR